MVIVIDSSSSSSSSSTYPDVESVRGAAESGIRPRQTASQSLQSSQSSLTEAAAAAAAAAAVARVAPPFRHVISHMLELPREIPVLFAQVHHVGTSAAIQPPVQMGKGFGVVMLGSMDRLEKLLECHRFLQIITGLRFRVRGRRAPAGGRRNSRE